MKCKWCGNDTEFADKECYECWKVITSLDHALHTKKLFTMMKRLVAARTKEIHEDGHF